MQGILCPMASGTFGNVGRQFPILAHAGHMNKMRCLFIRRRAKFHALRVPSQCAAEDPQWIGRTSENEGLRFVCVSSTWYEAHLQNTQPIKQQHRSSENVEKGEPAGLPRFVCWHDTLLSFSGFFLIKEKIFLRDVTYQNPQRDSICCRD